MRLIFTLLLGLLLGGNGISQQIFTPISEAQVPESVKSGDRGIIPDAFSTFAIDFEALQSQLVADQPTKVQLLRFPISEEQQLDFGMMEHSQMHPKLQAKFSEIRTFRGQSSDGRYTLNIAFSPYSTHAVLRSSNQMQYLIPYTEGVNDHAILFKRQDYPTPAELGLVCGNEDAFGLDPLSAFSLEKAGDPVATRSYRVAIATTSEFTTFKGGIPQAMDAINTALMIMNEIYNREMAVNLELIADNDQLIYNNNTSDPYIAISDAGGLLAQNQANLDDVLGSDAYDIGHIFTTACINNLLGIAARASVCNGNTKGRGVTCHPGQNIAVIISGTMAHEIGHSFDAGHTWNKCSPATEDQYASDSAFEPGSGTTIMSYAGACPGNNIANNGNNDYFNIGSIIQMTEFIEEDNGGTCVVESGSNATPDIDILSPGGVFIPISTPFRLKGTATDPENHNLTYCWEQFDLGPTANLGTPIGNGPSFRSFAPTTNPERIFPRLSNILAGTSTNAEVLATYTREYNFMLTVRDDNTPNAGVSWEKITFDATEDAGPFHVSSPALNNSWEIGTVQTVTWDVANTDVAPVNCQTVNIWLSYDGGQNFDVALAMGVDNTGSHDIILPNMTSSTARIMVEAAENIFFDINAGNFTIAAASAAGINLGFDNNNNVGKICIPNAHTFDLVTESLLGYSNAVTYSVSGLPSGASSSFAQNPATPDQTQSMTITFDNTVGEGDYDLVLTAEGDGMTTINRNFTVQAIDQDFSSLAIASPADGATGIAENASVTWTALNNVDSYDVRISTSPAFDENLSEGNNLTGTSFSPAQSFEKSTLYYWQVRGRNNCKEGDWTAISIFQTEIFSCSTITQDDALNIPVSTGTYESTLDVSQSGTISDLNVGLIDISYQPTVYLKVSLIAPSGKEEVLFDKKCGNDEQIAIGFDSEANNAIVCPPVGGGSFLPDGGDLTNFTGESTEGEWKLKIVTDDVPFNAGTLNEWRLEFCSNATPNSPFILTNELILVKTDDSQWISPDKLRVKDDDNSSSELVFTLVSLPEHGTLENDGTTLGIGDNFTQEEINTYKVKYIDGSDASTTDAFIFTVEDGTGGFLPPTTCMISIEDNNDPISGLTTIPANEFKVFPNPADEEIHIVSDRNQLDRKVTLVDSKGQVVANYNWQAGKSFKIATQSYAPGIYFLQIQENEAIGTKRFTIIR